MMEEIIVVYGIIEVELFLLYINEFFMSVNVYFYF